MADKKISDLTDGGTLQSTDELVVARAGANLKIAGNALGASSSDIDFQNDCDAVADGQVVADAAMTSGSAVLTSASGLFTSADVGKNIIVGAAGAAGADLRTTVASYQSATQVTLSATASATVSSAGAMWGTDNGPALQTALDAFATNKGGKLTVRRGNYLVFTAASHADYGNHNTPSAVFEGTGSGSRLLVAVGSAATMLRVGNLHRVLFDNLTFVGCPTSNCDAAKTLSLESCQQAIVRDCQFYGVSTGALAGDSSSVGVIYATASGLVLERTHFLGCLCPDAKSSAPVYSDNTLGFSADASIWFDWGYLDGIYYEKPLSTGVTSKAWVLFATGRGQTDANEQTVLRFTDCRFDEYATVAIRALPSVRYQELAVEGCQFNVTWVSGGLGIYASKFVNMRLNDNFSGDRTATPATNFIGIDDVTGVAEIKRNFLQSGTTGSGISVQSTVQRLVYEDNDSGFSLSSSAIIRASSSPAETVGLIGWSFDPAVTYSGPSQPSKGKVHLAAVVLPRDCLIQQACCRVTTGGSTLTASQNFLGLYSYNQNTGVVTLIGKAAMESVWNSSGAKSVSLDATYRGRAGEVVYVAFLINGTTAPTLSLCANTYADDFASASRFRWGYTTSSSYTALPASLTFSSDCAHTGAYDLFAAVS